MPDLLIVLFREHWLQLATGAVLPALVGLVTKLDAHPAVKSAANFLLSLAAGILEAIAANGGNIDAEQITTYVLTIWTTSHLAYKAVWKPAGGGVSDPVRLATPDLGVQGPVIDRKLAA